MRVEGDRRQLGVLRNERDRRQTCYYFSSICCMAMSGPSFYITMAVSYPVGLSLLFLSTIGFVGSLFRQNRIESEYDRKIDALKMRIQHI